VNEEKNFNEENENEEVSVSETPVNDTPNEETPVYTNDDDTAAATDDTDMETPEEAVVNAEPADESDDAIDAVEDAAEEAIAEAVSIDSEESVLNEQTTEQTDAFGVVENQLADENIAVEKKSNVGAIVAIAAAVVVVIALVIAAIVYLPSMLNKYNRQGYVNISGRTIGEVAEMSGMELDEFLEEFGLPEKMPANTTESAAYNNIPFSRMAQSYGRTTEDFKKMLQLPDDVNDDTPWGEAVNKATCGAYVGEEGFNEFKEYYGLGEDVTVETLWGEVRQTVEEKQRQERIDSEKEAKKSEKESAKQSADDNADIDAASTDIEADTPATDDAGADNTSQTE
jgi:hypothetical protein